VQYLKSIVADPGRARALWVALLMAASAAFTLGVACAAPFAAFGAIAALTLPRRDALLLAAALWLVNQTIGFTLLHYPSDGLTMVWGIVLGIVAVGATAAAQLAGRFLGTRRGIIAAAPASFAAAFVVYEGGLYIASAAALGGTEAYAAAIVLRILAINAAAFVGLMLLGWVAERLGLSAARSALAPRPARPA